VDILTLGAMTSAPRQPRGIYNWELQDLIVRHIGASCLR
jgi:hypothetical protein